MGAGVFRDVFDFQKNVKSRMFVEQIGTGTLFSRPETLPDFDYMKPGMRRVDALLAKWAFSEGVDMIMLPREEGWMKQEKIDNSIYGSYTSKLPVDFREDVKSFAFKKSQSGQDL